MAICRNCGAQVSDNSRFCGMCGFNMTGDTGRTQTYEGTIKKCPHCGAVLSSFAFFCKDCGYELRDSKQSIAVQNFQLEYSKLKYCNQKAHYIKSFTIPNNIEDIREFYLLSSRNITMGSLANCSQNQFNGEDPIELAEAWLVMLEETCQKSRWINGGSMLYDEIQSVLNDKRQIINLAKKERDSEIRRKQEEKRAEDEEKHRRELEEERYRSEMQHKQAVELEKQKSKNEVKQIKAGQNHDCLTAFLIGVAIVFGLIIFIGVVLRQIGVWFIGLF